MRLRFAVAAITVLAAVPVVAQSDRPAGGTTEDEIALGERLATLLRAGRGVVSQHQALFNDPAIGDKDFDGDRMVSEVEAAYVRRRGEPPVVADMPERDRRLTEAQIEAMREVVNEHENEIDMKDVGFKGFIPAVFGRLVNERFDEKVGTEARIKVTAPEELVRNRKALPDAWETRVIEESFRDPAWPKGLAFTEEVEVSGRPAFRMLLPEYYSASCLACHGSPKGELDVTGYPKEGAAEGDLGGAVSITLFR